MAKIYLSATYCDLKACRDAVYRILRMLRHDVIAMEDYVATDAYPLHKCLADVAACDLYVGLIGWRYGYIPEQDNPDRKSITELEYRQAGASGRPRLMFLVDQDAVWPDEFRDSATGDGDSGSRIAGFRAELENAKLVSYFRTPDHLAGLVSVAVQRCLEEKGLARPKIHSGVQQVKSQALGQRLNALLEDYQAATEQLAYTVNAVGQRRLKRQIEALEREMREVENESEALSADLDLSRQPDSGSHPGSARPQPRFENERLREVSEALDAAYRELEEGLSTGRDTTEVRKEILRLRRIIREGGQLKAGDFLGEGFGGRVGEGDGFRYALPILR